MRAANTDVAVSSKQASEPDRGGWPPSGEDPRLNARGGWPPSGEDPRLNAREPQAPHYEERSTWGVRDEVWSWTSEVRP